MTETDVLVIGAGPAGIAAATAAAQHGCAVLILDDNATAGGQIWREGVSSTSLLREPLRESALEHLSASGAQLRTGWRIFDAPNPHVLRAISGNTVENFHYRSLVIATGARERFLPFPGWTLPGVFGVGGLQALAKGGFPVDGQRVVLAGSGPLLIAVAAHLRQYGAKIVSVAEQASCKQLLLFTASLLMRPSKLLRAASYRAKFRQTPYRTNCWPVAALGNDRVTGIRLTDGTRTWEESCNLIACGFHLVPNTEVAALLGCAFRGDFIAVDELQRTSVENVYCAGEPVALMGLDGALAQGKIAGLVCANQLRKAQALRTRCESAHNFARKLDAAFRLRDELRTLSEPNSIVCRCEDVRYASLTAFNSWTEAKLQTRCGMGPCQGRICGPATQAIFGWQPGSVRPPLFPVPLAALCCGNSNSTATISHEDIQ